VEPFATSFVARASPFAEVGWRGTALAFTPTPASCGGVVQERDCLGDNLPSDYLIRVQQGGFYGWP